MTSARLDTDTPLGRMKSAQPRCRRDARASLPRRRRRIDDVVVAFILEDQGVDAVAGRGDVGRHPLERHVVVAQACTINWGCRSRRAGSASSYASGICSGVPPMNPSTAPAEVERTGQVGDEGLFHELRNDDRVITLTDPEREMSTGGVPDDEHPVEIEGSIDTGEGIDRRGDVIQRSRIATALVTDPPILDIPGGVPLRRASAACGSDRLLSYVLRQNPPWMKAITGNDPRLPFGELKAPELLRRVAVLTTSPMPTSRTPGSVTAGVVSSPCPSAPHAAARTAKTTGTDASCSTGDIEFNRTGGEQVDLGIIESEFGAHVTGVGTESRCGPDIRNRHAGRMEPGPLEGHAADRWLVEFDDETRDR